jgi:hypothetical protein
MTMMKELEGDSGIAAILQLIAYKVTINIAAIPLSPITPNMHCRCERSEATKVKFPIINLMFLKNIQENLALKSFTIKLRKSNF